MGERTESGIPRSLDYFNIRPFPELVKRFGEKPTTLYVMAPIDDVDQVAYGDKRRWGTGEKLIRKCDGVECVHLQASHGYKAGDVTECICEADPDMDDACKWDVLLRFFLVQSAEDATLWNPYAYTIITHSRTNLEHVRSVLFQMLAAYGSLRGLIFSISVEKVRGKDINVYPLLKMQLVKGTGKLLQIQAPGEVAND